MDPTKTLAEIRRLSADIATRDYGGVYAELIDDAVALAEYCDALDHWITCGGFLPDAWAPGPRTDERRAARLLTTVAARLDGQTWTPETCDDVARVLRAAGFQVRDADEFRS